MGRSRKALSRRARPPGETRRLEPRLGDLPRRRSQLPLGPGVYSEAAPVDWRSRNPSTGKALAFKQKLAGEFPAEVSYREQSANLGRELGIFLYDGGNDQAGAKLFPGAIDTLDRLAAEFPSMPIYRAELARCRRDYGKVLGHLKRPVEGTDQFEKAVALGERLVAEHPAVLPYQADLGLVYYYFANLLRSGDTPADSLEWYAKAIRTLTTAYAKDRQVFLTKIALYKCHADQAKTLSFLGKHAEAVPEWDMAIELCASGSLAHVSGAASACTSQGGPACAVLAELAEVTKSDPTDANHWYNFGCVHALASLKAAAGRKDELGGLAVVQLGAAVKAGYKNATRMAKDMDLDPIRDRDDFKKLLADLAANFPPKLEGATRPEDED